METKARKLVLEKFHQWIKVFGKKQSERIPTRKVWNHTIEVKEGFVPRKGKVYSLLRGEREKVRELIKEQLRKGYIWLSKSSQIVLVFFVGKKDGKETDSVRLQIFERVDDKEQLSAPSNIRCPEEHWDKEGLHKNRS